MATIGLEDFKKKHGIESGATNLSSQTDMMLEEEEDKSITA